MVSSATAFQLWIWLIAASAALAQVDNPFSTLRERARDETAGMTTDQKIAHWEKQ
jgi:hypothetical protein